MKNSTSELKIALFPIPGLVTFPFSTASLHVFEPRYRLLIKDSISAGLRIGVAHTQKTLSEGNFKVDASIEETLNSNQQNYLAHTVFSGGFAQIIETLSDGRLMVEIQMDSRYRIIKEVQEIPYKIVICEPFVDEIQAHDNAIREKLDQTLIELSNENDHELKSHIQSEAWKALSLEEYSFKIYSIIGFDSDIMQKVLELRSANERIQFLNDVLTRGPVQ